MFKNLMNGVSLSSLMLRAPDDESGADAKTALREKLAKGNTAPAADVVTPDPAEGDDEDEDEDEDDDEDGEKEEEAEGEKEEVAETDEQKKEREAKEKIEAKAKRKDDRMQRRIDNAIAEKKAAETEIARLKAQLEANPDQKLTAEEVETKAQALADKKQADREIKDIQDKFDAACDKLQADAKKIDKDFDSKIGDIAADVGPIPSFMIGVLEDFDNGGEVLAFIANDDELAEKIWSLAKRPAKMTKELVLISNKLIDLKKAPKKQISKVPDPGTPVQGRRIVSNVITDADTKDMDKYVAKRQRQIAEQRKLKGFN
jgi:hypothetical protein